MLWGWQAFFFWYITYIETQTKMFATFQLTSKSQDDYLSLIFSPLGPVFYTALTSNLDNTKSQTTCHHPEN